MGFAKIARDLSRQERAAESLRQAHATQDQRVAERTQELQPALAEHQTAQASVVSLLRKIVTAQEDERGRIARTLHDQLGQRLTALRLSLERAQERSSTPHGQDEDVARARELTHLIDAEVGFLAWVLRPAVLDQLLLGVALPRYVREWSEHYDIEAECKCDGFSQGLLSREAEVTLYRIAQEGLTNVAKHAHASRVDVMLESRDRTVILVVEDDGVGFDPDDPVTLQRGVGVLGMRERAGLIGAEFQLESGPGDGTSIFVRHAIAPSSSQQP